MTTSPAEALKGAAVPEGQSLLTPGGLTNAVESRVAAAGGIVGIASTALGIGALAWLGRKCWRKMWGQE